MITVRVDVRIGNIAWLTVVIKCKMHQPLRLKLGSRLSKGRMAGME